MSNTTCLASRIIGVHSFLLYAMPVLSMHLFNVSVVFLLALVLNIAPIFIKEEAECESPSDFVFDDRMLMGMENAIALWLKKELTVVYLSHHQHCENPSTSI